MYGKDGDIIDGRYLIVKIGTESIEMTLHGWPRPAGDQADGQ